MKRTSSTELISLFPKPNNIVSYLKSQLPLSVY